MQKLLVRSRYNPGRGGHAPGDLRDAFTGAVEVLSKRAPGECSSALVQVREHSVPVDRVFGLLWNCSDILPGWVADEVEDLLRGERLRRPTYGAASRLLLPLCQSESCAA